MQFNGYIKSCYFTLKLGIGMSVFMLLASCVTPVERDDETASKTLKNISGDIVDMVNTTTTEVQQKRQTLNASAHKNLYLAQQQSRLAQIPQALSTKYQQAVVLIQNKAYKRANLLLDEVIKQAPNLSGSYVNKAVIAYNENHLSDAEKWLDKAIKTNALNPYAYNFKGQLQRLNGHFAKAEQSYQQALANWNDYPDAHLNLAILLELYRGQLLQARQHYQAYLTLNPHDKKVTAYLAGLEIKIKRAGLTLPEEKHQPAVLLEQKSEKNHAVN